MSYQLTDIERVLDKYGEVECILESDRSYELHKHDTKFDEEAGEVITEGMIEGEYTVVRFPASSVEHFTYHKES